MTRRFRLAGVLRARQAQEDAARGAVLRARTDADIAAGRREQRERALDDRPVPGGGTGPAYVAALSARQALAGELTLAARVAGEAAGVVHDRQTDLTGAAVRRRTVERLAERHAAARQRAEESAGQRVLDELAAGRRRAGPAQAGAAQAGPAQAGPAQAGPAQAGPAQAGAAQAGAAQAGAAELESPQ